MARLEGLGKLINKINYLINGNYTRKQIMDFICQRIVLASSSIHTITFERKQAFCFNNFLHDLVHSKAENLIIKNIHSKCVNPKRNHKLFYGCLATKVTFRAVVEVRENGGVVVV